MRYLVVAILVVVVGLAVAGFLVGRRAGAAHALVDSAQAREAAILTELQQWAAQPPATNDTRNQLQVADQLLGLMPNLEQALHDLLAARQGAQATDCCEGLRRLSRVWDCRTLPTTWVRLFTCRPRA